MRVIMPIMYISRRNEVNFDADQLALQLRLEFSGQGTEERALRNYEIYFQLPQGTATMEQVKATSVGKEGIEYLAKWTPSSELLQKFESLQVSTNLNGELGSGFSTAPAGVSFDFDQDQLETMREPRGDGYHRPIKKILLA